MKKITYLFIFSFILVGSVFSVALAQDNTTNDHKTGSQTQKTSESQATTERSFDQSPVGVLNAVKNNANKHKVEDVQNTDLDNVTSTCNISVGGGNFTIAGTICNIRMHIGSYLQYVVYVGLTAATILLIRNGFKLVTAQDGSKQIQDFKKNIVYIIVGVILLIAFYYILDIFVSLINLVTE